MPSICLITTVHNPFDSRIFHKFARSLARAGYNVTLLGPDAPNTVIDGIHLIPLPAKPPAHLAWRRWLHLPQVWRQARKVHADLYLIHDPELTPVGLLLKWGGRRVVYDVIEHVPYQILDKQWILRRLRRIISWAYDHYERVIAGQFAAIIAAFEQIADRFPNAAPVIIRNVPDAALWPPAHPDQTDGSLIALYAGSVQADRCVLELVQAVNSLDGVELWIVGPFDTPAYEARLRAEAGDRIKMFGPLPHEQIPALMAQAHIGLMSLRPGPNSSVNWPIKLFEYMAAGLPMIMHDNPFWLALADGCALPVNIEDPHDIARGLAELARDPARRAVMGDQGRRLIRERYLWATQEQELLKLVGRLIGPPMHKDG